MAGNRRIAMLSCVMVVTGDHVPMAEIAALAREAARMADQFEIVIMGNGVGPETTLRLEALVAQVSDVTVHLLADRVDPDVATLIGMDRALGDWVVVMTPTLAEMEALLAVLAATATHQVVFAAAAGAEGDRLLGWFGRAFFAVSGRLAGVPLEWPTPRLRAYSRAAVRWLTHRLDGAVLMRSLHFRGAFPGRRLEIPALAADRPRRAWRGSLARAMRQFGRASTVPLRIAVALAIGGMGAGLFALAYTVLIYATHPTVQPGWTTLSGLLSIMMLVFSALFALLTTCVLAIYAAMQPHVRLPVVRELRSPGWRDGLPYDIAFGGTAAPPLGAPPDALPEAGPAEVPR